MVLSVVAGGATFIGSVTAGSNDASVDLTIGNSNDKIAVEISDTDLNTNANSVESYLINVNSTTENAKNTVGTGSDTGDNSAQKVQVLLADRNRDGVISKADVSIQNAAPDEGVKNVTYASNGKHNVWIADTSSSTTDSNQEGITYQKTVAVSTGSDTGDGSTTQITTSNPVGDRNGDSKLTTADVNLTSGASDESISGISRNADGTATVTIADSGGTTSDGSVETFTYLAVETVKASETGQDTGKFTGTTSIDTSDAVGTLQVSDKDDVGMVYWEAGSNKRTASQQYSAGGGGGGGSLPNSPYVSKPESKTYQSSVDSTVTVEYNATGMKTSDIGVELHANGGKVSSNTSLTATSGDAQITLAAGSLTGDTSVTFKLVNTSVNTVNATNSTTLTDLTDGKSHPNAAYINQSDTKINPRTTTTLKIEYNATTKTEYGSAQSLVIDIVDKNGNIVGYNSSLKNTEGVARVKVRTGAIAGDTKVTYKLKDFGKESPVIVKDTSMLLDDSPTGTLNGTVTDSQGNAVSGIKVRIRGFGNSKVVTTDANGDYSAELPVGEYAVTAAPEGYAKTFNPDIQIKENKTETVDLSLSQGGTINGKITKDSNGNAVPNAFVLINGDGVYYTQTNMSGQYSITVPEGNYTVTAFGGQKRIPKTNGEVTVSGGSTVTQDLTLVKTGLSNKSVSYVGGPGDPDMNNISLAARSEFGMIQVQLLNDTAQTGPGMPNELEGLGVKAQDEFEINFTVSGYNPKTLLWGAKNVSWSSTKIGSNLYNVSIHTETVTLQGINKGGLPIGPLQGRSPSAVSWPTGAQDKADLGWNRTVYFALFDGSNFQSERLGAVEGMTVTTNAQAFSRPRLVTETVNGNTRQELRVFVGGPNKTVNGLEHDGFYHAFIPNDILNDWGVNNPSVELSALYKGKSKSFSVNETSDGAWIKLDINYSAGQIEVGSTGEEKFDVSVDSTNGPVLEGNTLKVDVKVTNTGSASGTQTVTLDVDGTQVDSKSVTVTKGNSKTVTLKYTTTNTDVGNPDITVASDDDSATSSVTVQAEAFFDVTIDSIDSSVGIGETVTVDYTVDNTGDVSGTQDITFSVDGTTISTRSGVQIAGGGSASGQFTYTTTNSDTPDIDVKLATDDDSTRQTVDVKLDPANFAVSIDSVNSSVTAGGDVMVQYTVENTGGQSGTQTISFSVGGSQQSSQSIQLGSGETKSDTFTYTTSSADTPSIDLKVASNNDEATRTVTVKQKVNFDVSVDSVNSSVTAGGDVVVQYTVQNTGSESGTQTITFSVGGSQKSSQRLQLSAGETKSRTFTYTTSSADTPSIDLTVASDDDSETRTVTVSEQSVATFNVSIESTNAPVMAGEMLSVDVNVTNTGSAKGTQLVTLDVAGTEVTNESVTLNASATTTVTLNYTTTAADAGSLGITAASDNDSATSTVTVNQQTGVNFDVSVAGTNGPVLAGEMLSVDVNVTNTGSAKGTQLVTLDVAGTEVTNESVTLNASATTTVTLNYTTTSSDLGSLNFTVTSDNDSASGTVTVDEKSDLEVRRVGVENEHAASNAASIPGGEVVQTETVNLTATVRNTGQSTVTDDVTLSFGSVVSETVTVSNLSANARVQVYVTVRLGTISSGNYTLRGTAGNSSSEATISVRKLGDINHDGSVGPGDTVKAQRQIVGKKIPGNYNPAAANASKGKGIGPGDVTQVQKIIVGLLDPEKDMSVKTKVRATGTRSLPGRP